MFTTEIERILRKDKQFIGCFPIDSLPTFPQKLPAKMIVNTGASSTKGEHWVALLLNSKRCFYFDSFGLPVLDNEIHRFLSQCYKKIIYSNKCVQKYSSEKCGEFCIKFLERVKDKKTYIKFLKHFCDYNLSCNDRII